MDDLITFIFIIIAALSVLGKIQPKKKAGTKSSTTGGWLTRLNTYLADLQDKIEQQAKAKPSPDSSGWDELMDDADGDDDLYDADEYSLADVELAEENPHIAAEKKPPLPIPTPSPVSIPTKQLDRSIAPAPPAAQPKPALQAGKMARNRKDLRNAIIWSEILGPPVALRDQRSHQR